MPEPTESPLTAKIDTLRQAWDAYAMNASIADGHVHGCEWLSGIGTKCSCGCEAVELAIIDLVDGTVTVTPSATSSAA